MVKYLLLAAALIGCTPQGYYGVTFDTRKEDPKVTAAELAVVLDEWDAKVGVRHLYPITLNGDGASMWRRNDLGECLRVGKSRFLTVNLDLIGTYPVPAKVFRHVIFHELYHAEATCSDKDHSSDPKDLMYPTVLESNLDALPTKAQRAAIGAK